MRILFSTNPAVGHLFPLLPLARAFARRGYDVAVLTSAGMAGLLASEPVTHLAAGPMPDVLFEEVARRNGTDPAGNPTPEGVGEFFAGARLDLGADEAIERATSWKPDLVVGEMVDVIAPLVAATAGTPLATLAFGPPLPAPLLDAIVATAAPRFAARGLTAPATLAAGRWLLDTSPQAFGTTVPPAGTTRLALRPEPHRAAGGSPARDGAKLAPGARPRVLVTFGSFFGDADLLETIVAGLLEGPEGLDAEIAVTAGLAPAPESFLASSGARVVPFAPLADLLEGVDAVVTHGGAGTTLGTLARGIPLVVLPQGADQPVQAAAVERAGAGIALAPGRPDAARLRQAVRDVLEEPRYARAAWAVRDEIAAMPDPADVADRLAAEVAAASAAR
ncbi:glycosyltransferase [Patulibacter americanus]|uniref:glycosyltransferase n=1 Tax=Patulibacter americanus TaxID=588672 RepID=UPI0003B6D572|nr:glycosyltransferase [Patulibacter americanus]